VEPTLNGIRIYTKDIGQVTAEQAFEMYEADHMSFGGEENIEISFENGPEPAQYTVDELQKLLNLMIRYEGYVLIRLGIVTGYRGYEPCTWEDVVLYRGDQEYLYDDIHLDEAAVCLMANALHSDPKNGERHCISVVKKGDLPDDLQDQAHKLTPDQVRNFAVVIISHGEIIFAAPHGQGSWEPHTFGLLTTFAVDADSLGRLPSKFKSTSLRPVMP